MASRQLAVLALLALLAVPGAAKKPKGIKEARAMSRQGSTGAVCPALAGVTAVLAGLGRQGRWASSGSVSGWGAGRQCDPFKGAAILYSPVERLYNLPAALGGHGFHEAGVGRSISCYQATY
mmetsp:Transcript_11630/g.32957  ORF Transcript_11630/g.32957 Transcript_11630/m.32957 type:complete len:122 (-) Transcript_11630:627-992(-)